MTARGLLVRNERGLPAHLTFGDTLAGRATVCRHIYDATHPEARALTCGRRCARIIIAMGIKIWWLDACEPEIYPVDHDNLRYHLGNGPGSRQYLPAAARSRAFTRA